MRSRRRRRARLRVNVCGLASSTQCSAGSLFEAEPLRAPPPRSRELGLDVDVDARSASRARRLHHPGPSTVPRSEAASCSSLDGLRSSQAACGCDAVVGTASSSRQHASGITSVFLGDTGVKRGVPDLLRSSASCAVIGRSCAGCLRALPPLQTARGASRRRAAAARCFLRGAILRAPPRSSLSVCA